MKKMKTAEIASVLPKINAILPPRFPWSGLMAYGRDILQIDEESPLTIVARACVGPRNLEVAASVAIGHATAPTVAW
jgi:hypothetical protein